MCAVNGCTQMTQGSFAAITTMEIDHAVSRCDAVSDAVALAVYQFIIF